jgi:hypothetical protein
MVSRAIVLAVALVSAATAHSEDGNLQSVLSRNACLSTVLRETWSSASARSYEVNCFASSHPILTVVCTQERCSLNNSANSDE